MEHLYMKICTEILFHNHKPSVTGPVLRVMNKFRDLLVVDGMSFLRVDGATHRVLQHFLVRLSSH